MKNNEVRRIFFIQRLRHTNSQSNQSNLLISTIPSGTKLWDAIKHYETYSKVFEISVRERWIRRVSKVLSYPIFSRTRSRFSATLKFSTRALPAVIEISPVNILKVVVLPEPLIPNKPKHSDDFTPTQRPLTAGNFLPNFQP